MKLNLGCGKDYREDMYNVDLSEHYKADLHIDLEDPWPWKNDSIKEIHARHLLEHIHNLIHFMAEAWRVLIPGGRFYITVPWWAGHHAAGDPTHCRFFNDQSFLGWCDWLDDYPHLNLGRRFIKESQTFDYDSGCGRDQFLKDGGFSKILTMNLILVKTL